jgi:hypothetical protein
MSSVEVNEFLAVCIRFSLVRYGCFPLPVGLCPPLEHEQWNAVGPPLPRVFRQKRAPFYIRIPDQEWECSIGRQGIPKISDIMGINSTVWGDGWHYPVFFALCNLKDDREAKAIATIS